MVLASNSYGVLFNKSVVFVSLIVKTITFIFTACLP